MSCLGAALTFAFACAAHAAIDADALDPCGMLSSKAIGAQLGKAVAEGRKTNEAGGGKSKSRMVTCTWDIGKEGAVLLMLWAYPTPKRGIDYLEQFRKSAKDIGSPTPTPVRIGEEAILDGASVHARKATNTFSLTVQLPGGGKEQKAAAVHAEALAKLVAAKL
jgi:hypothetical protein